jgi:hypothetical protein
MKKSIIAAFLLAAALAGCGGGGSSTPQNTTSTTTSGSGGTTSTTSNQTITPAAAVANQVQVQVTGATGAMNAPLVSVTICEPNASNCSTISNVLLDTGSTGLRLFKSAMPALSLPSETNPSTGDSVAECLNFAGGVAWGSMVTADVKMAGETASSVPIQVIDNSSSVLPTSCSSQNTLLTQSGLMANGVLGIASPRDCGDGCITAGTGSWYYDCAATSCTSYGAPWAQQATNPVTLFASDNNGVILSFPGLATGVSQAVVGTLTFGLDTQTDNSSSGVSMVQGVSNGMSTTYSGMSMTAIFDSGSSADYISSAPFATCTIYSEQWFCPTTTTSQSVSFSGGAASLPVTFSIANAQTVLAQSGYAYANVAADDALFDEAYLDLGMSYLFGHNLFLGYPGTTGNVATIGVQDNQVLAQ